MERESFMDQEIARFLNENFVCIKVDREERPDIDSIYMTSLTIFNQLTRNGRGGGWPLSMFMTSEGKPFFGGTYFPARDGDRPGVPGFLTVARRVAQAWNEKRDLVKRDAERLTELVRNELNGRRDAAAGEIQAAWVEECTRVLAERFDPVYGGFGYAEDEPGRPKFPEASNLIFLLSVAGDPDSSDREAARNMLHVTLDRMGQGGIYDHIGGGFHRYSVDRFWRIPHFEKMLYDNAQLMSVYAAAAKMYPEKPEYRQVCDEIFRFLQREMTAGQGAFYAALDAESEGEEGRFYRWEKADLQETLGEVDFPVYAAVYGIDADPNFEERYYVPQLNRTWPEVAAEFDLTVGELQQRLRSLNDRLLAVREQRARPLRDEKILTSWNGLMIRGLADAGRLLDKPEYVAAAARAADFLWTHSYVEGRLQRTYTAGQARLNGYLDDYAFFIDGLLGLHEATGDRQWLTRAAELQERQDEWFRDEQAGGYFFTSADHESLLARAKNPTDGALPSGNSVSLANLMYLGKALDREDYRQWVEKSLQGSSSLLADYPAIAPRLLVPVREVADR
jgi:uncharacterized protein YyaL (SSP411 family)